MSRLTPLIEPRPRVGLLDPHDVIDRIAGRAGPVLGPVVGIGEGHLQVDIFETGVGAFENGKVDRRVGWTPWFLARARISRLRPTTLRMMRPAASDHPDAGGEALAALVSELQPFEPDIVDQSVAPVVDQRPGLEVGERAATVGGDVADPDVPNERFIV